MQESVDAVLNYTRAVHHWYVFETLRDRGTSSGKYGQDEMTAGTGNTRRPGTAEECDEEIGVEQGRR